MTGTHGTHHMSEEEKESIAMEKYGCKFEELDTNQKKAVGSIGRARMAHGGEGGEAMEHMEATEAAAPQAATGTHATRASARATETTGAGGGGGGAGAVEHEEHHHMTDEEKNTIARAKFGKDFDQLDANQKRAVGGQYRAAELGSEGYSAMAHKRGTGHGQ